MFVDSVSHKTMETTPVPLADENGVHYKVKCINLEFKSFSVTQLKTVKSPCIDFKVDSNLFLVVIVSQYTSHSLVF